MLLRKYHVVIFKENEGVCKKFHLRGWTIFAAVGLVVALIAGSLHYWTYFPRYSYARYQLRNSEKTIDEQKSQLLSLTSKLKTMEKDMARVRDFDTRLRVMLNLDSHFEPTSATGGADSATFSKTYLPIHRQELIARKMHNFLNQLNVDVRMEELRQQELLDSLRGHEDLLAATPTIWPAEGWISSGFGQRISPFTGQREMHPGLDISGRLGTPVKAPARGVVVFNGVDGGYGNTLMIKHGNGLATRYAHLQQVAVKEGDSVKRGDTIGFMGTSGRSTGPHLHYEVRLNGVCVNPERYIVN